MIAIVAALIIAGELCAATVRVLGRHVRGRADHEPRAVRLLDAPKPPERTWKEAYYLGDATLMGTCTWCGGVWTHEHPRRPHDVWKEPIKLPIAGPGRSVLR